MAKIDIGGTLHSTALGPTEVKSNVVANADEILDVELNKKQDTINSEVTTDVSNLKTAVGTGGSVDSRIATAKAEIIGDASTNYNTLGKVEDSIESIDSTLENAAYLGTDSGSAVIAGFDPQSDTLWKKAQVLSTAQKNQVKTNLGLDSDFEVVYSLYRALNQSDIVVGTLPVTGNANTIYRVPGESSYTDWMYYNNSWVEMATYDNAIDDEPTAGSNNLVKSGGVFGKIQENPQTGYYVCDSASGNRKSLTMPNYILVNGGSFKVKMLYNHISVGTPPTLNINNTGDKKVFYEGIEASYLNTWDAGEVLEIYYDASADEGNGAYYACNIKGYHADNTPIKDSNNLVKSGGVFEKIQENPQTGYYVCDSGNTANPKIISSSNFLLKNGGCFHIKMNHAHTAYAAPTLNINNTGAKKIYYRGLEASRLNTWSDNEILEVYYDSTADEGNGAYYANTVGGNMSIDSSIEVGNRNFVTTDTIAKKFRTIYDKYITTVSLSSSAEINLSYKPVVGKTLYLYLKHSASTLGTFTLRFKDSNNSIISSTSLYSQNINEITIPNNCTYLTIYVGSTQVSQTENLILEIYEGELFITELDLIHTQEILDNNFLDNNLFDKNSIIKGATLRSDGSLTSSPTKFVSAFIKVDALKKVLFSRFNTIPNLTVGEYSDNKSFIRFNYSSTVTGITLNQNTTYIRLSGLLSIVDSIFATQGTDIFIKPTSYKGLYNEGLSEECLLNSSILKEEAEGKNLYNPNALFKGLGINIDDGSIVLNDNYSITDKIRVTPLRYYYINQIANLYDSEDNLISTINPSSERKVKKLPASARYLRLAVRYDSTPLVIEQGTDFIPNNPQYEAFYGGNYSNSNKLNLPLIKSYCKNDLNQDYFYGKKLAVDGDSITHDQGFHNYWQFVVENNLMMNLVSSSFVYDDVTYVIGAQGIAGSRIAYGIEENEKPYCISARYNDLPSDADVIIIAGGTNDWAHSGVQLGTMSDRTNVTFYGALHVLCLGLINKYPTKTIVFMTPIKRGTHADGVNQLGYTLKMFVDAIIEVCGYYGIPVIDMFRDCTMNPSIPVQKQEYFLPNDDTHPNDAGQFKMGTLVTGKLKTLI